MGKILGLLRGGFSSLKAHPWILIAVISSLGGFYWWSYERGKAACAAQFAEQLVEDLQDQVETGIKITEDTFRKKAELDNERQAIQEDVNELPPIECGKPLPDEWVRKLN